MYNGRGGRASTARFISQSVAQRERKRGREIIFEHSRDANLADNGEFNEHRALPRTQIVSLHYHCVKLPPLTVTTVSLASILLSPAFCKRRKNLQLRQINVFDFGRVNLSNCLFHNLRIKIS